MPFLAGAWRSVIAAELQHLAARAGVHLRERALPGGGGGAFGRPAVARPREVARGAAVLPGDLLACEVIAAWPAAVVLARIVLLRGAQRAAMAGVLAGLLAASCRPGITSPSPDAAWSMPAAVPGEAASGGGTSTRRR